MVLKIIETPKINVGPKGHLICTVAVEFTISYGKTFLPQEITLQGRYIYVGEFRRGADGGLILSGNGKVFPELSETPIYEGYFRDGLREGVGKLWIPQFYIYYDGPWKNDKRQGRGISKYLDGEYDGYWKNNMREGKGIFYDSNGNKSYDGDWKNGMKDGKGVSYYSKGDKSYDGDWKNGMRNGKGVSYHLNGNKGYDGDWKNDLMDGIGICYYLDGVTYDGEWKEDKMNGRGIERHADGRTYDGEWKNGKMNGQTTYTDRTGHLCEQRLYRDDRPIKRTNMSCEFWRDGNIVKKAPGEKRRERYTAEYGEDNNVSLVTYNLYGPRGILERKIMVDYSKLNELLNKGKLDSIVPEAIVDVTEGLREEERIKTFGEAQDYLKVCSKQILLDQMYSGEKGLDEGVYMEITNIILLVGLKGSNIKMVRFFVYKFNKEEMKLCYSSVRAFLESINIGLGDIGSIKENSISVAMMITITEIDKGHAFSAIIDIKMIKELVYGGKDINATTKPVIFIFDSSNTIIDRFFGWDSFGNIRKNCVLINREMQRLKVCWYHAASATIVASRNPNICEDLRRNVIVKLNNPREQQSLWMLSGLTDTLLTKFETEQILQLRTTAKENDFEVVDDLLISKRVVRYNIISMSMQFLNINKLVEVFEGRAIALIKKEEEVGASFSEETKNSLRKEYVARLLEGTKNITLELVRGRCYNDPLGARARPQEEEFFLVMERIEVLYSVENELLQKLLEIRGLRAAESELNSNVGEKDRNRVHSVKK